MWCSSLSPHLVTVRKRTLQSSQAEGDGPGPNDLTFRRATRSRVRFAATPPTLMLTGMQTIQSQVDGLISQMTPAEKAGQLTQYFYFRLPGNAAPALGFDADAQPKMVESALQAGGAGSLLFVTNPAEINRLQRLAIDR